MGGGGLGLFFFSSSFPFWEPSGFIRSLQCFSAAVDRTDIGIQETVSRVEVICI